MSVQQAETKFYDEGGVLITNARAVLGETTYPLANISSVGVGRSEPSGVPLLVAGLLFLVSVICALSEETRIYGILGAVVFGLIAFVAIQNQQPSYYVKLGSNSGEQRALAGHSQAEVEKIVAALNEAIIQRG